MCKVGIIGTGTVGSAVGVLLHRKGYTVTGVCSKTGISAAAVAEQLGCEQFASPGEILWGAQVILLTVPDRELHNLSWQLASSQALSEEHIILHMSGALPAEVLAPLKGSGAAIGSVHPLQSFASVEKAIENLPGSFFAVQGDQRAVEVCLKIVEDLKGRPFTIDKDDKALYHMGACIASNYLVALVHYALSIYSKIGMSDEQAMAGLMPLIKGTLSNIEALGPAKALTGPVARGDVDTIRRHLSAAGKVDPGLPGLYKSLGCYTTQVALEKKSIDRAAAEELLATFREEEDHWPIKK